MNKVRGYVWLKKTANCEFAQGDASLWQGDILRALEINLDTKSLLLVDSKVTGLGMFDLEDANLYFKCEEMNNILIPENLSIIEQSVYMTERINRKGGYNEDIKKMVIVHSLQKGKLDDDFLFTKQ